MRLCVSVNPASALFIRRWNVEDSDLSVWRMLSSPHIYILLFNFHFSIAQGKIHCGKVSGASEGIEGGINCSVSPLLAQASFPLHHWPHSWALQIAFILAALLVVLQLQWCVWQLGFDWRTLLCMWKDLQTLSIDCGVVTSLWMSDQWNPN